MHFLTSSENITLITVLLVLAMAMSCSMGGSRQSALHPPPGPQGSTDHWIGPLN